MTGYNARWQIGADVRCQAAIIKEVVAETKEAFSQIQRKAYGGQICNTKGPM